ncbi:MAG TPA: ParA family protein [Myxococcota bacterium]|nr:ParA family protein [Myxococcota bacterium]HQK49747.1 ParA family protein [Myxococcota bacterium]
MTISDRLLRWTSRLTEDTSGATVLAVAAQKGGVGKTTTAVNLAIAMARFARRRTLLIDLDGQGHVERSLRGLLKSGSDGWGLAEVLLGSNRDLRPLVRATAEERLYVTPSDRNLASAEGVLAGRIGKEFLLRQALRPIRPDFDLIVLDCPPNLGNLTLNALMAADGLVIPCEMSVLALAGVSDLMEVVATLRDRLDHEVRPLGILPTRVDRRNSRVTGAVLKELESRFAGLVTQTRIPVSTALAQAQMAGVPVFDFDPASPGARAYRVLAGELSTRIEAMSRAA